MSEPTCPICAGEGRVLEIVRCSTCGGTGQRNVADGLSVIECVQRLAKEARDYRDAASAEAFHGDEARAERDELREQVAKLREALALAGIPLEVLHATERGGVALCGPVQDSIAVAVPVIREALAATAPKEPAK